MKIFFHIWWREVSAYFRTSMAYVTGFFFLAVAGFGFWNATARWAQAPSPGHFANGLFGSVWYWLAMLVGTPLLALRLFAEENRTGTLETLLAAPVTETTIVLAKFASAFSLFLLLWAPPLAYGFLSRHCGAQYPAMPWGWVAAGYFGTALVGAFFLAIALFCSLWTRHQDGRGKGRPRRPGNSAGPRLHPCPCVGNLVRRGASRRAHPPHAGFRRGNCGYPASDLVRQRNGSGVVHDHSSSGGAPPALSSPCCHA